MMYPIASFQGKRGGCSGVASSPLHPRTPTAVLLLDDVTANEISPNNLDSDFLASSLCRQLGYPRVCIGASGRVRREPSLGDSTPAGAENSQATLYIASAELRTQGIAKDKYPAFAASKSRILGID